MILLMFLMHQSKRSWAAPAFGGGCFSHLSKTGCHPKSVGLTKMIPARDTVAGEAFRRFSTSNTILQLSVIGIRSLFARVRILLSSRTVFRFSIQMASTGPSQTIQVVYFSERL